MTGVRGVSPVSRWVAALVSSLIGLLVFIAPVSSQAESDHCSHDQSQIDAALARIRTSTDPCGESPQVATLLQQLSQCGYENFRICTNTRIDRNVFERPSGERGEGSLTTIKWNPQLHTKLEEGCDGDPTKPVLRDPTASLLHELAHAIQACMGLNPGEHELEAVRIENIYRRAAGLCQRRSYGRELLPSYMLKTCDAWQCSCSTPGNGSQLAQGAPAAPPAAPAESGSLPGDRPKY